jgi:two-component system KDP operon response regulator KdpE
MNEIILIVDDEPDIRFLLKRILSSYKYEVKEAENIKQGLHIYAETQPHIVVLDVNLPDGNGIQFASRFKASNNILILISADNDQLTNEFENYLADGFLRKPFSPADLIKLIQEIKVKKKAIN